mmetsp:Transcript_12744/g.32584  ORF Transcript_12744/g.32584 Transcript_12744/m.32584 type:complete len:154 (-) Transcript_12744:693-1154(-)
MGALEEVASTRATSHSHMRSASRSGVDASMRASTRALALPRSSTLPRCCLDAASTPKLYCDQFLMSSGAPVDFCFHSDRDRLRDLAPATVTVIRCHAGNASTANAWELGDALFFFLTTSPTQTEGDGKAAAPYNSGPDSAITVHTPAQTHATR